TPAGPPGNDAPTISASATMITDWITTTTASLTIRPAISASRLTGETRNRPVTPRLMSSISAIPLHAELNIAVITTIPGARNAMYEPPWNPGISTTRLNSAPNRSSQITGWTSVTPTNHG